MFYKSAKKAVTRALFQPSLACLLSLSHLIPRGFFLHLASSNTSTQQRRISRTTFQHEWSLNKTVNLPKIVYIQYTLPQSNLLLPFSCGLPRTADVMLSNHACLYSTPWPVELGHREPDVRFSCVSPVIDHEFPNNIVKVPLDPRGDNIFYDNCRNSSLWANCRCQWASRHAIRQQARADNLRPR